MANSDYLTISGSQINLVTYECTIDRCTPFVRGGIPELSFSRILGKLTALPDPWSGQSVSWSNGSSYPGTVYFAGDVVGYSDRYEPEVGWVREYRARSPQPGGLCSGHRQQHALRYRQLQFALG